MDPSEILALRQHNLLLTNPTTRSPADVVAWLGAIQAQDYLGAKWAIGLRTQNINDKQVEEAFNQGKIIRTHVMRPTWHFVTPNDIRWLLRLTKERVHKINRYYYRQLGLDEPMLKKCIKLIIHSLQGNRYLTRQEIGEKLKKTYNFTKEVNLLIGHILMYAELEAIICSGPRKGKQFTYALLEERVPERAWLDAEVCLAELTLRYFQSHGPATLQDFVWWSGLSTLDAKKGIELIKQKISQEMIGGNRYFFINLEIIKKREILMDLLPNYDEYIIGYKDRQFIFDSKHLTNFDSRANPLFQHTIILDGKIIGTWKREFKRDSVLLSTNMFGSLNINNEKLLKQAVGQFEVYMGNFIKR